MTCEICSGIGFVRTERGASAACSCQVQAEIDCRLRRAQIPPGFNGATLDNYQPRPHTKAAHAFARRFTEEFIPGRPAELSGRISGLLMTGSVGTGKTHLAVGIARRLIQEKGIEARFVDVRELLDRLRNSYEDGARESQAQILAPIFKAELVVIDELGANRPTDWMFETVELLIGGLYNRLVTTIVTTNLPNQPAGGAAETGSNSYARAARPETLGDRIGMRMWSRLQQMCRPIEMIGPDWRLER